MAVDPTYYFQAGQWYRPAGVTRVARGDECFIGEDGSVRVSGIKGYTDDPKIILETCARPDHELDGWQADTITYEIISAIRDSITRTKDLSEAQRYIDLNETIKSIENKYIPKLERYNDRALEQTR